MKTTLFATALTVTLIGCGGGGGNSDDTTLPVSPTAEPTPTATVMPTVAPTTPPTAAPTPAPTMVVVPTTVPTPTATAEPTPTATPVPTMAPTMAPTVAPTATPTPTPELFPVRLSPEPVPEGSLRVGVLRVDSLTFDDLNNDEAKAQKYRDLTGEYDVLIVEGIAQETPQDVANKRSVAEMLANNHRVIVDERDTGFPTDLIGLVKESVDLVDRGFVNNSGNRLEILIQFRGVLLSIIDSTANAGESGSVYFGYRFATEQGKNAGIIFSNFDARRLPQLRTEVEESDLCTDTDLASIIPFDFDSRTIAESFILDHLFVNRAAFSLVTGPAMYMYDDMHELMNGESLSLAYPIEIVLTPNGGDLDFDELKPCD